MHRILLIGLALLLSCFATQAQYKGSASVSQGLATTETANLYNCAGGRIGGVGSIVALDKTVWTVPAATHFTDPGFPFASDLHNSCTGKTFANVSAALNSLDGTDIITVDPDGEVITAFIFADNYFEMYVNGVAIGKDRVPYTQFNSSIVRFRVRKPFLVALLLVDWEEHLGLGAENSNGFAYHYGDGGIVAAFKDASNAVIDITDASWKAQTFYTSPISDLTCPTEVANLRLSNNCSTQDVANGSQFYALHWPVPTNWMSSDFDATQWPDATTYTNAEIGVDNKPAYTNFTQVFDDATHDAEFIWSTNVILDNLVIVRKMIGIASSSVHDATDGDKLRIIPNPTRREFCLEFKDRNAVADMQRLVIVNMLGQIVLDLDRDFTTVTLPQTVPGIYYVLLLNAHEWISKKLVVETGE